MFRFSCFRPHIQSNKPKNTAEPFAEATVKKGSQDGANQASKDSSIPSNTEFQVNSGPANDDKKELLINESDNQIRDDHRVTTGMEAAKSHISSLSAGATEAQQPNRGLHLFLRTSENVKDLTFTNKAMSTEDTSGYVSSTTSHLEFVQKQYLHHRGLCKLTRLRVLDLSYNRIRSIGHGLASCSSLKELYLAGNRISEVEGLHRLSRLTILDIRFNEISSAKCLGQLAANYKSLQAISLDGNPAQNSVGDEMLKKYLQFILPNLVYYNGQPLKIDTLGDAADQSVQLDVSSPHFDRILRSDHKIIKKGNHSVAAANKRPSNTFARASRNETMKSSKRSKGKHDNKVFLPPTETKISTRSRILSRKYWFPILH